MVSKCVACLASIAIRTIFAIEKSVFPFSFWLIWSRLTTVFPRCSCCSSSSFSRPRYCLSGERVINGKACERRIEFAIHARQLLIEEDSLMHFRCCGFLLGCLWRLSGGVWHGNQGLLWRLSIIIERQVESRIDSRSIDGARLIDLTKSGLKTTLTVQEQTEKAGRKTQPRYEGEGQRG
jgi:hypothetical protein